MDMLFNSVIVGNVNHALLNSKKLVIKDIVRKLLSFQMLIQKKFSRRYSKKTEEH